jgi:hypothetical protein
MGPPDPEGWEPRLSSVAPRGTLGTLRHTACADRARSFLDTRVKNFFINKGLPLWMGGRAVEGTGLENRNCPSPAVSSYPVSSGFTPVFSLPIEPLSRLVSFSPDALGANSGAEWAPLRLQNPALYARPWRRRWFHAP